MLTYKNTLGQYILAIGLALLTLPLGYFFVLLKNNLGWNFQTIAFIALFFLQAFYYYITTNLNVGFSILSFIFNFILWVPEQVLIGHALDHIFIYQGHLVGGAVIGGLLWASNKIFIDLLFSMNKKIMLRKSRIDLLLFKMFRRAS